MLLALKTPRRNSHPLHCIVHCVFVIWLSRQWKMLQNFSIVWSVAGSENVHISWHRNNITSHTVVTSVGFDPTTVCIPSHHTNKPLNFNFRAKIQDVPFGASLNAVSLVGCPGGYRLSMWQRCCDRGHDRRDSCANGHGLNVRLMNSRMFIDWCKN
jgi:hypothetical protein